MKMHPAYGELKISIYRKRILNLRRWKKHLEQTKK